MNYNLTIILVILLLYLGLLFWILAVSLRLLKSPLKTVISRRSKKMKVDNTILRINSGLSVEKKNYLRTKNMIRRMRTNKSVNQGILFLPMNSEKANRLYRNKVIGAAEHKAALEGVVYLKFGKNSHVK